MTHQMILCKRIATAFMYINGDNIRKKLADDRMSVIDLQTEYVKYQERKKIIDKISSVFKGTEYEKLVLQIVDVIIASDGLKVLYLNSLKSFGKEKGIEVYKKIKNNSISIV